VEIASARHWLEAAINEDRDPKTIATAICEHPEFKKLIASAVTGAGRDQFGSTDEQTRYIAESLVSRLYKSFNGFTASHG
jgi:hypothetical protein